MRTPNPTAITAFFGVLFLCVGAGLQFGVPVAMMLIGAIGLVLAVADVLLDLRVKDETTR